MKNKFFIKLFCSLILILIFFTNIIYANTLSCSNLQDLEKIIIKQLYLRNFEFNLTYTGSTTELEDTLNGTFSKDMYIKSTINYYEWSYEGYVGEINININANHIITYEEETLCDMKIKEILKQIITNDMNTHEKIKAVNDWIVLNCKYDSTLVNNSHYDLLFVGNSVCNGYALLTYKMLKKLEIPVILISGNSKDQSHIWNMVKIDNYWFHLDTTWNDPIPDKEGFVSYNYYLLSDEEIKLDHSYNNNYPVAAKPYYKFLIELINSEKDNHKYIKLAEDLNLDIYFKENTVDSYDKFIDIISSKINSEPNSLVIRCSENVVNKVINSNFSILYHNNNITNIKFSIKDDKTGSYKILELYLDYKNKPGNTSNNNNPPDDIKVKVFDKYINFDQPPIIENGRTLVPVRAIFETLGLTVNWDGETRTVTGIKDNMKIVLVIDDKTAYINDSPFELDVPARIINSRTLVPIRFISEVLNRKVSWDSESRTVYIN